MDKHDFLVLLRERLHSLSKEDTERYIEYYSEMIDDRIEEGKSEEEAVREIGTPKKIAEQILGEVSESKPEDIKQKEESKGEKTSAKQKRKLGGLEITLIILGAPLWIPLIAAMFSVIISILAVIFSVIISLFAAVFSIVACGISGIIASPVIFVYSGVGAGLVIIGASLVLTGASVFLFRGWRMLVRWTVSGIKKSFVLIKSLFSAKEA